MRALSLALVLWSLASPAARSEEPPFHAGIVFLGETADETVRVEVWYPTPTVDRAAAFDSQPRPPAFSPAPAEGRFPVVLLSHGGGPTGGSPAILAGLSTALARHGFIVVAPFHRNSRLSLRAGQVVWALDAALADARLAPHMDPSRLGMIGFSLGGAVTLELSGARPDGRHFQAYCTAHPDDVMSCDHAPAGAKSGGEERPMDPPRLSLKAIVLLDPLAALFQRDGLAAVTMPVLLIRPAQSQLPGEGNAFALAASLPQAPQFSTVPGDHFILTDICRPEAPAAEGPLCRDPPGVDRVAIHADAEARMARFFGDNL